MNTLHSNKRFVISRLEKVRRNTLIEFGYTHFDTINDNYYRMLARISMATSMDELNDIRPHEEALLGQV